MLDGKLHEDDGALVVADILRLVAAGRLFDREAIDYEAAERWYNDHAFDKWSKDGDSNWLRALFAAALGDTDE
jgi:hypothetical protein